MLVPSPGPLTLEPFSLPCQRPFRLAGMPGRHRLAPSRSRLYLTTFPQLSQPLEPLTQYSADTIDGLINGRVGVEVSFLQKLLCRTASSQRRCDKSQRYPRDPEIFGLTRPTRSPSRRSVNSSLGSMYSCKASARSILRTLSSTRILSFSTAAGDSQSTVSQSARPLRKSTLHSVSLFVSCGPLKPALGWLPLPGPSAARPTRPAARSIAKDRSGSVSLPQLRRRARVLTPRSVLPRARPAVLEDAGRTRAPESEAPSAASSMAEEVVTYDGKRTSASSPLGPSSV